MSFRFDGAMEVHCNRKTGRQMTKRECGKSKNSMLPKNGRDHYAKITEVNIEKGYVRYSDSDTKRGTINIDKLDGIMFYEKNK